MKRRRESRWKTLGLGVGLGLALGQALGALWPHVSLESEAAAAPLGRKAFDGAVDAMLERYVEPVDAADILGRGLKHMVAGLDDHSFYLTAPERAAARKAGRVRGTSGLTVSLAHRGARSGATAEIVGVLPGSPAAALGLAPGDHLLEVGDRSVRGLLGQAELEVALAGEAGDPLALRVQRRRRPSPERVELTLADAGPLRLVEFEVRSQRGKRFAIVQIHAFRAGVGDTVKRALANARRKGKLDGIVLDVRGNPGGEVQQALIIADLFVEDGVLTRTRGRDGNVLREERAHPAGTDAKTPLAVLVDRHSASASELLAAALQENGRARVVGERSYGKGTVQEIIGLSDGSVLKLTVARYYSPKDRVIDGAGVQPDVAVAGTREDQLVATLESLKSG